MWDRRQITRICVLAPVVVLLLVIAGWAIDTGSSTGEVRRNVNLAGTDISGLGSDDLLQRIGEIDVAYGATPIEIRTPQSTYETTASEVGLRVDTAATARAALDEGRTARLPARPFGWLLSFVRDHDALEIGRIMLVTKTAQSLYSKFGFKAVHQTDTTFMVREVQPLYP